VVEAADETKVNYVSVVGVAA